MARMCRNGTLSLWIRALCFSAFLAFLFLSFAALPPQSIAASRALPVGQIQDSFPCRAFMDWLSDPGGKLNIPDVSAPAQQENFTPFDAPGVKFPPQPAGTLWLRLTLAPRFPTVRPPALLLDMGDGLPGVPVLFAPKQTPFAESPAWQDFKPGSRNIFLLPEAQADPLTVYIRLEGLPGPWFMPVVRTPHNAASSPDRMIYPAVLTALSAAVLLCLLRGLSERGQWRLWTALYTTTSLLHAWWGMPATPEGNVLLHDLPGILAPGIALMLLPHVGRHLMRTHSAARLLDIQYLLLSLPGALLALLPLLPGFAWTSYYLSFWPAATMLFIPTSLGAWLSGLPGARRFLLACLAPLLGAAVGIIGTYLSASSPLFATSPLWGVALGALLIAGTAAPKEYEKEETPVPTPRLPVLEKTLPLPSGAETPDVDILTLPGPQAQASLSLSALSAGESDHPKSAADGIDPEEPGLRLLPPEEILPEGSELDAASSSPAPNDVNRSAPEGLRPLLDNLLRESAGISLCALPPAARQHAEAIQKTGRELVALIGNVPPPTLKAPMSASPHKVFDLQQILREAHNRVAGEAERKGLNISWFMPPHLSQYYYGNAEGLARLMLLLLESSVRASQKGFVQIAVRRVPESVNPGHLLFSVSDTGTALPPDGRDALVSTRAWELAGEHGGSFSAESDARGSTVSFSLHLTPHAAPHDAVQTSTRQTRVVIADELASSRRLLAFFLEDLPCLVLEARSLEEAFRLCAEKKTDLLLIDCDMPDAENPEALSGLREYERETGLEPMPILALETENAQRQGRRFPAPVHTLSKPITRSGLREAVRQILLLEETSAAPQDRPESRLGEEPLDLPPPITYGPGRTPEEQSSFVPLSLNHSSGLSASASPPAHMPAEQGADFDDFPPAASRPLAAPEMFPTSSDAALRFHADRQRKTADTAPPMRTPVPFPASLDHDWSAKSAPVRVPILIPFDRYASIPPLEEMPEPESPETPPAEGGLAQGALLDWVAGARAAASTPRAAAETRPRHRQVPPAAFMPARNAMQLAMEEWVGEPMPVARQPAVWSRPSAPTDAVEWVGEPMPIQRPPQAWQRVQPVPAAPPERRAAAPANAVEWVGEPMPIQRPPQTPEQSFVSLRLTDTPRSATRAEKTQQPPSSLFPEDSSLLGFVLGNASAEENQPARGARSLLSLLSGRKKRPAPVQNAAAKEQPQLKERSAFSARREEQAPLKHTAPTQETSSYSASAIEHMQPLIPGLLASLDEALDDVRRGFSKADTVTVEEAAARIAARADNYGLRILARMARCVEMAAKARDKDALSNILPDLETAVERNRIALTPKR